ncbi:TPA: hypothetical protein U2Q68_004735 [Citrobacter amalonaticus]|nr:hypothetical protein [Citrobacter amalonaticus]
MLFNECLKFGEFCVCQPADGWILDARVGVDHIVMLADVCAIAGSPYQRHQEEVQNALRVLS